MTYSTVFLGGDKGSHIQTKHQTKLSFLKNFWAESTKHHNVKEFKKTLNLDKF